MLVDPKSVKKTDYLTVFFTLLGSVSVKAVHRTLMKLSPDDNFTKLFEESKNVLIVIVFHSSIYKPKLFPRFLVNTT